MKKSIFLCGIVLLTAGCVTDLTQEKFNTVKTGMSLPEVQYTVDPEYWDARCVKDEDADPDLVKDNQERYVCRGDGMRGYTVTFTFERGRLVRKFSNGRLNYAE